MAHRLHTWLTAAIVIGVCALANVTSELVFRESNFIWVGFLVEFGWEGLQFASYFPQSTSWQALPLTSIWWGILAGQMFLLGAYIACSGLYPVSRLLWGWSATALLFGAWLRADYLTHQANLIPEAWDTMIPPIMGRAIGSFLAMFSAMTCTLWLQTWWYSLHLRPIRSESCANDSRRNWRWSILDLLILTFLVAATVAILRLVPISIGPFRSGTSIGAVFGVRAGCAAVVGLIGFQCLWRFVICWDKRRTAWRPQHLSLLAGTQLLFLIAGFASSASSFWVLTFTMLSFANSFAFTVVAALMLADYIGWELSKPVREMSHE